TRALDTMGALKLVSRHRDERDRRNVLVKRTVEGALYIESIGDDIIAKALDLPLEERDRAKATELNAHDPRINAIRADLADARLKGVVEAERFAAGRPASIA